MNQNWYNRFFFGAPARRSNALQTEADSGNAEAQFSVGLICSLRENYLDAAGWYLKAAQQNHALAQLNLGISHSRGQGVPRNGNEACLWFTRAAEQGDAGAQFNLGVERHRASLDQVTEHARESRIEAYKWLQLAMAQEYVGSEAASDRVTMSMDKAEVAAGNLRVADFIKARPTQPSV